MEFIKLTEIKRTKSFNEIIKHLAKYKNRSERLLAVPHGTDWIDKPWKEDGYIWFSSKVIAFSLTKPLKNIVTLNGEEMPYKPPLTKLFEYSERNCETEKQRMEDEDFHRLEYDFTQKTEAIKIFGHKYNVFYLRHLLVIMGIYDLPISYQAPKDTSCNLILRSAIGWGLIARIRE